MLQRTRLASFAACFLTAAGFAHAQVARPPAGGAAAPMQQPANMQPVPLDQAPPGMGPAPADFQVNPDHPFPLMVGDPAPFLKFSDYLLGEPALRWEPGKIYLLVPFALFCEPCMDLLPRVAALQTELQSKDLVVIGVTSPSPTNSLEALQAYIFERKTNVFTFAIAYDQQRALFDDLLYHAGRSSLPVMIIIDRQGKLAYLGGIATFEPALRQIVAGTYDLKKAARDAVTEARTAGAMAQYSKLMAEKSYLEAYALGRRILSDIGPEVYAAAANIAWSILDPANAPKQMDTELALMAAERANTLSAGTSHTSLSTLARAYFLRGDVAKAASIQSDAVTRAPSEKIRKRFENDLQQYVMALQRQQEQQKDQQRNQQQAPSQTQKAPQPAATPQPPK